MTTKLSTRAAATFVFLVFTAALSVNSVGQLQVATQHGSFYDDVPYAHPEIDGQRVEVSMKCDIGAGMRSKTKSFGFSIGGYDPTKPLVLDGRATWERIISS